jgi:23S rRNA pseudouridine1911/1915/1917 synthase
MPMADEERQLTVPADWPAGRADRLLAALCPEFSRSRWQKFFRDGRVWMDDRVLSQKDRLHRGDVVTVSIPPAVPLDLRPVPLPLRILHEDEAIIVLNKASGQVVHPGAGTGEDTLVHGLLHHCRGSLRGIGGTERPGIVHRLDKETSGVLVVAKTGPAHQSLVEQFAGRTVGKRYRALVAGIPAVAEGIMEDPIGRHPVHRTRMACRPDGRNARTDYHVERTWPTARVARLAFRLHTGRTHQIRVHMQARGHPLLGDRQYGYKPSWLPAGLSVPRVMLHASRLEFAHPVSGEPCAFEAGEPEDFRLLEAALERGEAGESR